ncbi:MAG: hypothetical protein LKI53_04730 [Bacteroidales bacterium]|jgi:ATP-dependent Lon protease|nr:hypothetical protein [Bacteroidales bacterium]
MGFLSNILMAFLGFIHPIVALVGSTIKYVTSQAKNAGTIFIVDIVANMLPGGFAKDLAAGFVSDAIEALSIDSAVNQVVPQNQISLQCERCGTYSQFYVKKDGLITCKKCFQNNVESNFERKGRIYLLKDNITLIKNELVTYNKQQLSNNYKNFNNSYERPSLSNKFKNFKK